MRILAFTDLHSEKKYIKKIIKKSQNVDILICAGDITWFGEDLNKILRKLSKIKKDIYIIHGNHESPSVLKKACSKYKNIHFKHKTSFRINNFVFFFWGGGGFAERDLKLEKAIKKFKSKLKKEDEVIFITHGPAYKTKLDYLDWTGYVGSKSIKKFIRTIKPILHICGHLHETFGVKEVLYKKTLSINPGPDGRILKI